MLSSPPAAALHIEVPVWLTEASAGVVLPDPAARMAFVVELARRNVGRGGGPFAAAVFERDGGRLLAAGVNQVVASHCSAAHAELMALSLAQQRLGSFDLGAAGLPAFELVASAEPCTMCMGAVLWSGVRSLAFGALDADVRAIGFDEGPKHPAWADELRRRGIQVAAGRLRAESAAVLRDYAAAGGAIYNASRR